MILIICTNNESNLTNRYWDMVPDWRTEGRTDGRMDDAKTISLRLCREDNKTDPQKKHRLWKYIHKESSNAYSKQFTTNA